jgi:hypothetical protein
MVTVEVPVPQLVYCAVPSLAAPLLAIAKLKVDSPPADTIRSYASTVIVLKSAVRQRDAIIQSCANPAEEN